MKKILLFSTLAAAALSVLSCEREPLVREGGEGGPVSLSLGLNLSGISTKAFADGSQVDELYVGVYDSEGNFLSDLTPAEPIAWTPNGAQFNATVTVGESYKIAFWAQKSGSGNYSVDFSAKTITANYSANTVANDETRDAFYALYETGTVTEAVNANVTLKRPLAQLNLLTPTENVTEAAQRETPVSIASAGMTVSAVKNVLNPLDGTLSGSVDVTFQPAACSEATILEDYAYIGMNYIFAETNEANKTVSVVVNFEGADAQTFSLTNVPVKRNRRTNLRGNVFPAAETPQPVSVDLTLTATIDADFDENPATADLSNDQQGGNEPTTASWELVSDFTSITSGDKYMFVATNSEKDYYMPSTDAAVGKVLAVELTADPTSASFETVDAMCFILTGNVTDGFTMSNASGNTLKITATNNGLKIDSGDGTVLKFHTEDSLDGTIVTGNDTAATPVARYIGLYNGQDFRCYNSVNNNIKASSNYRWYHYIGE